MFLNNKPVLISFALSCGLLLLVGFFWGFYYEDNQVVLVNLLYYAKPNETLTTEWMNDFDFLLVPLWAYLGQKIKHFPFYAVWQLLQPFLWLTGLFYFFLFELELQQKWKKVIAVLLIVALGLDSLVSQICFRNSLFLAGASLLFIRHRLINGSPLGMWPTALFIFSLTPRSHPAAMVLALFMSHEILMGLGIRKVVSAHLPHILASVVVIASYQLYGSFATPNTGKIIEAGYEYAWLEKGAYKPLSDMKTTKDSLKYWAVQQWYIADSAEFTIDFIDRVVDRSQHYTSIFSFSTLINAGTELWYLFSTYWYLSGLLFFFTFFVPLFSSVNRHIHWVTVMYFGILCLLLLFLVNMLKERFFVPFTAIAILVMLSDWLQRKKTNSHSPAFMLLFILAVSLTCCFQVQRAGLIARQFSAADKDALVNLKALNAYTNDKAVLLTIDVPVPDVRNVFYRAKESPYNNLAWLEAGYMVYYPYMEWRMKNTAGFSALRFKDFLAAVKKNSKLRVIATPRRIHLLQTYSKGVYGREIQFSEDSIQPNPNMSYKAYFLIVKNDFHKLEQNDLHGLIFLIRNTQ